MASIKTMKRDVKEFDATEFFNQTPENVEAGKKEIFVIRKYTVLERGQINLIMAEDATPERREKAVQRCADIRIKAESITDPAEREKLLDSATPEQQIEISAQAIKKLEMHTLLSCVDSAPFDEGWNEEVIDYIEKINHPLYDKLLEVIREFNRPPARGN